MRREHWVSALVTAVWLCWSASLDAEVRLLPLPLSGVANPTFVTHAGDGSNRLFVVEQAGVVRVLRPGVSTATVFLDIRRKVLSGGEQGLLGLAFHPLYAQNGRFFVCYTRPGDGTVVVAEYRALDNPDVADVTESVILTIPHPTNGNHNGGMLAFGPGGYLYIGVGDGGSANDPPNNAQNIDVLLGKLLRIDIDRSNPADGTRYTSPPSNPFVGRAGRDEIFALGLRNPWRFSFDRSTGQQWVADVGQGAREEVNSPILGGANLGWRVYEGTGCTNNDPALCRPGDFTFPLFEYTHTGGRCSITGGYVYRGGRGTLPSGTYVYGDYCSGEIFAWDGRAQTVIIDTDVSIASFGEDEQGELYVVGLGGTVSRIVPVSCTVVTSTSAATFRRAGGRGQVGVSAAPGCVWEAVSNDSWITITSGGTGNQDGVVSYSVAPFATHRSARTGTVTIAGYTFTVTQTR